MRRQKVISLYQTWVCQQKWVRIPFAVCSKNRLSAFSFAIYGVAQLKGCLLTV